MALRAQRKRQGGGSTGTGSYDPRHPNRASGVGSTHGPIASTNPPPKPKPKPGPSVAGGTAPPVQGPSAAYVRRPPPAPQAPVAGASSTALRGNAESALGIARGQNRDAIYRAIMQLGDTSQFAQYAADPRFAGYSFVQDPNSIFAQLARQESKGLEDIDLGANVGNTFFSGMRNRDRQEFSDETGRQRLAGSTSFQDDLKAYAASLGLSEGQYRQAMADADQMDIDAALERDRIAREQFDREEQQRADEAAAAAAAAPQVTASAPQAGTPAPTTITQVSPSTPGHPGVYVQDHGPRAGLQYIIKDGVKWYESKKGKKDWGKGGKIGMTP